MRTHKHIRIKVNINVQKDNPKDLPKNEVSADPYQRLKKELLDEVKEWYLELYEQ